MEAFDVQEDLQSHKATLILFNDAILFARVAYNKMTRNTECEYGSFFPLSGTDILRYDNGIS